MITNEERLNLEARIKELEEQLTRVDQERGKEAVATFTAMAFNMKRGGMLFLSPTIPPSMVLVPIEPTYDQCAAGHKAGRKLEGVAKLRESYKAMIQAAGVTK